LGLGKRKVRKKEVAKKKGGKYLRKTGLTEKQKEIIRAMPEKTGRGKEKPRPSSFQPTRGERGGGEATEESSRPKRKGPVRFYGWEKRQKGRVMKGKKTQEPRRGKEDGRTRRTSNPPAV